MATIQKRGHGGLLLTYLRPERTRVIMLALLLLGSIGLQLANPQILKRFLDQATAGAADATLATAAVIFMVVAVLQQVLTVGATYFSENVAWGATNELRTDLLQHCLGLDQSFHKTRTPGELIERIDGDVTALANFFSQLVIQILGNGLLLIGVLIVLWSIDWRIGLVLTGFSLLTMVVMSRVQRWVVGDWKVARQVSAELYGYLEERMAGTEDIRSSGAQAYSMHGLYRRLAAQLRAEWRARLKGRTTWVAANMLFACATATTYLLGATLFHAGEATIGTIYLVVFYTGLLIRPIQTISQQAEDLQKASAGIARVEELLQVTTKLPDEASHALPLGALPVRYADVTFGYDDDVAVLRDVSFDLVPGRVLGLLGRTGSGKTTLTRLLYRLYDPQQGSVEVGGADVRNVGLHELRRRVGVVTQDVQLFNASIRDNLTFFDRSIDDARILQAIETLGLAPWYRTLGQGLDTVLLGGGGGLSAGEAQLLAFTRIFLRDPGLVILDEASSRLDPATEQLIERAVDRLLEGRTAIIIAHRLHTLFRADEVLILDAGQVIERGERETLANDPDSRFAQLLRTGLEAALA